MPPLAAEPRGTALYCSRSTDTSCVGGGSERERRSSGCDWHTVARFCARRPSAVRVAIAQPPGPSRGSRGPKCPGAPLGRTHSTLLQVWMGSFSWTGAISLDPRATEGTIRSGSDLHWCGKWDVRCVRPARFGAIHNALPERQAQASSPAPWGFPRTAEPGLWGALYRRRTGLGACSPRLGEGALPL